MTGRGLDGQHRFGEPSSIPMVGLDDFCITAGEVNCRRELAQEKTVAGEAALQEERREGSLIKCFIMRCFPSKAAFILHPLQRRWREPVRCQSGRQGCGVAVAHPLHPEG